MKLAPGSVENNKPGPEIPTKYDYKRRHCDRNLFVVPGRTCRSLGTYVGDSVKFGYNWLVAQ